MITTAHIGFGVGGAVVLVLSALAWAGVLRSWAYGRAGLSVVTFLPALALAAVAYGLLPIAPDPVVGALILFGSLWFPVGAIIYAARPRWYAPRWVKDDWRRRGLDGWTTT